MEKKRKAEEKRARREERNQPGYVAPEDDMSGYGFPEDDEDEAT